MLSAAAGASPTRRGSRYRTKVRLAEVCAPKLQASLEQFFNSPFMFIRIELSDACAERGADRWAGRVEPRGQLMRQQVGRHFQCVPSRGRMRMRDVVSLQRGKRVTRTAPACTEVDVSELAEGPPKDSQALPPRGLQPARRAGSSSHVLDACRPGWLDAVSAGPAGLLKDAPHACHRVVGVFEPEPPSRMERRGRSAQGICLLPTGPPCR